MQTETVVGLDIPPIGMGTMRLDGEEGRTAVREALEMGYRHLDTARMYGNEEAVGAGIRASSVPREDIILATKLGRDEMSRADVATAIASSLARLDTDYIDVMLIHWPSPTVDVAETLEALESARQQGQIRAIGVANFPSALFESVADTPGLIGNQVEYHPYLSQQPVLTIAREHGLVVTAYCPLSRGGDVLTDPVLADIAATHKRSVPQIALRWLVQQPNVVAIPGSGDPAHLRENADVLDFSLTDDEMDAIHALARGGRVVNPPHAPQWDER